MAKPSERLGQLNLSLPPVATPVGAYVPAVRLGELLMLSGQIPMLDGQVVYSGKVGAAEGATLEQAQAAARMCTLNALAVAAQTVGGIDKIAQVVKVVVYVAAAPGFTDVHKVANGASDLLAEVFGDAGKHARAAVGVAELPLNSSVEVDVTFRVAN